jgi:hypothetical protein
MVKVRVPTQLVMLALAALLLGSSAAQAQQCYTVAGKLYCTTPQGSSKQMYCWTSGRQTFCS